MTMSSTNRAKILLLVLWRQRPGVYFIGLYMWGANLVTSFLKVIIPAYFRLCILLHILMYIYSLGSTYK